MSEMVSNEETRTKIDNERSKISLQYVYGRLFFLLSERQNPNMSILSSGNPFAERILFWVLLLEKMSNMY